MTTHNPLKTIFVPITKIDAAKRLVYGSATAEAPDKANEICDYATTKPYYEKWSADIAKATDGKSLGNVRAMHGNIAAGKLTSIGFDDAAKSIDICAHVVDDNEWKKVEAGVYTGFSQGGKYVKTWKDPDQPDMTRYTAEPIEVSLVDLPCLPGSTFTMVKADGATELRKFATPQEPVITNAQVADKATELAKAAGDASLWTDHITAARAALVKAATPEPVAVVTPEPAVTDPAATNFDPDVVQVWKAADGTTHGKKADAIKATADFRAAELAKTAHPAIAAAAEIVAALDKRDGKEAPEPAAGTEAIVEKAAGKARLTVIKSLAADIEKAPADLTKLVSKGMYDVGTLASLISQLSYIAKESQWEAENEGDNSTVPGQLKTAVDALCQILRAMVIEETGELVAGKSFTIESFEDAAGLLPHGHIDALVKMAEAGEVAPTAKAHIEKVGARHGKADKARINAAHDLLVDAGADCGGDAMKQAAGDLAKVTTERDAASKALTDLMPILKDISERVKSIEAQPAQGTPTAFRVVGKGEDNDQASALEAITPDQLSLLAFKLAQQQGRPISERGR